MIKVAFRITESFTLKGYAFLDRLNCKKETFIIMAMNVNQSVIKVTGTSRNIVFTTRPASVIFCVGNTVTMRTAGGKIFSSTYP